MLQLQDRSSLDLPRIELDFKKSLENIKIEKIEQIYLYLSLERYKINNGFYSAIFGKRPGGYIDFHNNNLLILSSKGILAYTKNINSERF